MRGTRAQAKAFSGNYLLPSSSIGGRIGSLTQTPTRLV